jgi:hypothetical protein
MLFVFGKGEGRGGRSRGFRGGRVPVGFGSGIQPFACICPECDLVVPQKLGLPCFQAKCPRCNSPMTRQFFPEGEM